MGSGKSKKAKNREGAGGGTSERERAPVVAPKPAWTRCELRARLLEDGHFGSGTGGGGIDALVARDRDGHPVIWASHVEGVLRDHASRLHGEGVALGFFGGPGGARQRAIFTSLYCNDDPQTHVWRATARGAFDNRAPKDDTLRAVEHVPQGTEFVGEIELPRTDLPLLAELVGETGALGRARSTGSGSVRLELKAIDPRSSPPQGGAQERLLLLLRNLDPVSVTSTATPDNFQPCLPFIPGRTLSGAIVAWLLAEGKPGEASALARGDVSVGDALPLSVEISEAFRLKQTFLSEIEVLPAPLALGTEKPGGAIGEVPWWAEAQPSRARVDMLTRAPGAAPCKRPEPDRFVARAKPKDAWTTFQPMTRTRLRNGRPEPGQADPSLFAVEQIVERTHFLCELRGDSKVLGQLAAALEPVLAGARWLRVGRGGAPVEVEAHAWARPRRPEPVGEVAYLTLTSDLLIRDATLRWRVALDEDALRSLVSNGGEAPSALEMLDARQEPTEIHGFNGTARLWRMPAAGIRRGSVFRLRGSGIRLLADRIAKGDWLGERVHEGFGRFRLDTCLPGTHEAGPPVAIARRAISAAELSEERVCATTREWLARLHDARPPADGRPSLSQWLDLVSELERGDPGALVRRLAPEKAGARRWSDPGVAQVLRTLSAIGDARARAAHARAFARWLRVAEAGGSR
jgi:hypothetical protein